MNFNRNRTSAQGNGDWNPDPNVDYNGPYPVHQLQAARQVLINHLTYPRSDVLQRIMPRCGIGTRYGPGQRPPPLGPHVPYIISSPAPYAAAARPIEEKDDDEDNDCIVTASYPAFYSNVNASPQATKQQQQQQLQQNERNSTGKKRAQDNSHDTTQNEPRIKSRKEEGKDSVSPDKKKEIVETASFIPLTMKPTDSEECKADAKPTSSGIKKDKIPFLCESQSSQSESEVDDQGAKKHDDTPDGLRLEKIRNFRLWTTDDPHGAVPNTEIIFKCDTCDFASRTQRMVTIHLADKCHYSCSAYRAVVKKEEILLVSVYRVLEITNEKAWMQAQVVRCPSCGDMFPDIFTCAMHHKHVHGGDNSVNGLYSVCQVMSEEILDVTKCPGCEETVSNYSAMRKHYLHFPPLKKESNADTMFACNVRTCKKLRFRAQAIYNHALKHEKGKNSVHKVWDVRNSGLSCKKKLVSVSGIVLSLPAFDSESGNALIKEYEVMMRTKKYYAPASAGGKMRRRMLREACRALLANLSSTVKIDDLAGGEESEDSDEAE